MKQIVYFSTQFTTVKSGPGRFVEYLQTLKSDELSFVFITDDLEQKQASNNNILRASRLRFVDKLPFYWIYRAYSFYKTFKKWQKKGHSVDAIMCSSALEAMFLFKYSGRIPIFIMVNDYKYLKAHVGFREMFTTNRISKIISRLIGYHAERYSVKNADIVVANSLYTQDAIKKIYNIPDEKIKVLYKAVDTSSFKFKSRNFTKVNRFLFAKNDWRIGGLDLIISAFSKLSWQNEISLTVAGAPLSEHEEIKKIASEKGYKGKLEIFPLLNRTQLQEQFYNHDIYIMMSRQEALGVSLLEAMSTGIPVIASNEGGIPEVLDFGKAGIMVVKDDLNSLVNVLNEIKSDPSSMKTKVEYAENHCRNFSKEKMQTNLEGLFA